MTEIYVFVLKNLFLDLHFVNDLYLPSLKEVFRDKNTVATKTFIAEKLNDCSEKKRRREQDSVGRVSTKKMTSQPLDE